MARRLFPKEALRQPFKVSFTSTERQGVEAKAHGAGLTLAAFIRRAALGQKVATLPQPNAEKWQDLARLAGNLNQLTKMANSGQPVEVDATLLMEVAVLVRNLRFDLIGVEAES